jgi:hypothetical protein
MQVGKPFAGTSVNKSALPDPAKPLSKPSGSAPREQKPIQSARKEVSAGPTTGSAQERRQKAARIPGGGGASDKAAAGHVSFGYSLQHPNGVLPTPSPDYLNLEKVRT